jgi:hypothetical protein
MLAATHPISWRTDFRKHFYFFRSRYRIKTALAAPLAALLYAIFLQRKHALKWFAWGRSA